MTRLDKIRAHVLEVEQRHAHPGAAALQRYVPAEVRAADQVDSGKITFSGHAAVFDRMSHDLGGFREVIKRGAFRKALDGNADVVALINHRELPVMGRTTAGTLQLREDPRGLFTWIESAGDHPDIVHVRGAVDRGEITSMSFGFSGASDEWTTGTDGEVVRTINEFRDLYDVSVVTFPAYPQTDVRAAGANEDDGDHPTDTSVDEPPTGSQEQRTLTAAWCRRRLHLHTIGGADLRTNNKEAAL